MVDRPGTDSLVALYGESSLGCLEAQEKDRKGYALFPPGESPGTGLVYGGGHRDQSPFDLQLFRAPADEVCAGFCGPCPALLYHASFLQEGSEILYFRGDLCTIDIPGWNLAGAIGGCGAGL